MHLITFLRTQYLHIICCYYFIHFCLPVSLLVGFSCSYYVCILSCSISLVIVCFRFSVHCVIFFFSMSRRPSVSLPLFSSAALYVYNRLVFLVPLFPSFVVVWLQFLFVPIWASSRFFGRFLLYRSLLIKEKKKYFSLLTRIWNVYLYWRYQSSISLVQRYHTCSLGVFRGGLPLPTSRIFDQKNMVQRFEKM